MVVFTTGHHGHRVRAHCDHREVEGMLFEEGEHIVRGGERGVVASSACEPPLRSSQFEIFDRTKLFEIEKILGGRYKIFFTDPRIHDS